MTSWRTALFLLLSLAHLSREHCADVLNMAKWSGESLALTFPLAPHSDPRETVECTLRLACKTTAAMCSVVSDCFESDGQRSPVTCGGPGPQNISFYHLMCLTAKAVGYPPLGVVPQGCKYENVWDLYSRLTYQTTTTTTTTTTTPTTPTTPPATAPAGHTDSNSGHYGDPGASACTFLCGPCVVLCVFIAVLVLLGYRCWTRRTQARTPEQFDSSSYLSQTSVAVPLVSPRVCPGRSLRVGRNQGSRSSSN